MVSAPARPSAGSAARDMPAATRPAPEPTPTPRHGRILTAGRDATLVYNLSVVIPTEPDLHFVGPVVQPDARVSWWSERRGKPKSDRQQLSGSGDRAGMSPP